MADFDDLLNFDGPSENTGNTNNDPFDPLGSTGNSGGNLLDLGFDAQISTDNGNSGKLNIEANTNPLYEFTNTSSNMESDSSNPLYEFNNEPVQKDTKSEPSNLLYEYMQNEGQSNGHTENGLTNGASHEVDLLGGGDDLLGGGTYHSGGGDDLLGGGVNESEGGVDLLGGGVNESEGGVDLLGGGADQSGGVDLLGGSYNQPGGGDDLLGESSDAPQSEVDLLGGDNSVVDDNKDTLVEPEPVDVQESEPVKIEETEPVNIEETETEPVNVQEPEPEVEDEPEVTTEINDESREVTADETNESFEPEQEKEEPVLNEEQISDRPETSNNEIVDQSSGPTESVPEVNVAAEEVTADKAEEAVNEGTIEDSQVDGETEQVVADSVDEKNEAEEPEKGTMETVEAVPDKVEEVNDTNEEIPEENNDVPEVPETKEGSVSELVAETDEQFDDADVDDGKGEVDVVDKEPVPVEAEREEIDDDVPVPEAVEEASQPVEPASESQDVVDVPEPVVEAVSEPVVEADAPVEQENVAEEAVPEVEAVPSEPVAEERQPEPELGTETKDDVDTAPAEVENVSEEIPEVVEAVKENIEPEQAEVEENVPEQTDVETKDTTADVKETDVPVTKEADITAVPDEKIADTLDNMDEDISTTIAKETEQVNETRNDEPNENALKVNGTSEISENGISEEEAVRDPNVYRETHEKEEIHFAEMNNVRQKFESGKTTDEEPAPKKVSVKDEYDQGGEFENEPVRNPDVVREADQPPQELPEVGMAKNLVSRFKTISEEQSKHVPKARHASPPRAAEKVEYESQPTEHLPQYENKVESGVYESEPKGHEDVIRSGDKGEDYKPEQGSAKNILNKFKEFESGKSPQKTPEKREITPDRSGKVEYVSEPRGESIKYEEAKSDSGVFENVPKEEEDVVRSGDKASEILPESGFAKSVLSKFKQMESEVGNKPPPSPKRQSVDRTHRPESVGEQKGYLEKYEPQFEAGEFENQPVQHAEVVRSGEHSEEVLPEVGAAKKTMERFKEIQKQSSSPVSSSSRAKGITPPREVSPGRTVAGVVENQPQSREDVVRSGETAPELLPEQGTTRNMLNKFKEIQTGNSQTSSPGRKPKEFTPPPDSGVYENTPKEHLVVETRQSESGVLESTPTKSTADIARDREASPEQEMPEQGYAKNMVSKWKQLESSSASGSPSKSTSYTSPRFKEFTPPRDSRGPLSPKSPIGVANGVHPSELPGQYQPQESSVIVENNPEVKEGVYRESDTDASFGMPAPNTTASMLQKFKEIQNKAKDNESNQAPITRKDDSPSPQESEEKGMFKVVQTEKCAACQKTVYAMEKLEMNGHIYHKNCFKCSHCSARLTPKTFSMNEGVIYCVNHFKQLFARKGNYDEGFGRQQYKKKWGETKKEGATA